MVIIMTNMDNLTLIIQKLAEIQQIKEHQKGLLKKLDKALKK